MWRSDPEKKFLRREGTYKTMFNDKVFIEVNLSKKIPLHITLAVVGCPCKHTLHQWTPQSHEINSY